MSKIKSSIPTSLGQKTHVNLDATSIGTTDFGRLDVLYHTPINPGEDVNISLRGVLQAAPLVINTFGKFRYDVRCFFVPNRILTHRPEEGPTNFVWDYFIQNLSNAQHPSIQFSSFLYVLNSSASPLSALQKQDLRRLLSQLRYPEKLVNSTVQYDITQAWQQTKVSPFPLMSYTRIWWDFYRNPQWIDESLLSTYIPYPTPGINAASNVVSWASPRYACWDKDYFTNVVPFNKYNYNSVASAASVSPSDVQLNEVNTDKQVLVEQGGTLHEGQQIFQNQGVSVVPVAWIRSAMAIDNYLSRMGIVGTRVRDRLKARFGINPSYERPNSAMYLGGASKDFTLGSNDIVTDTYDSTQQSGPASNAFNLGNNADGRLSGQRVGKLDQSYGFENIKFHSKEYGTLMVIGTLIPDTGYYQGLNKDLTLGTSSAVNEQRTDYLTPELSNIGMQLVRLGELWNDGTNDTSPWGWTQRYGSYAYQPNVVDGDMLLTTTYQGMDSFHLFREFSSYPVNGNAFTTIFPEDRRMLARIFQIANPSSTTETLDHFTRFSIVNCDVVRAMSPSWLPELYEDNNHGNTVSMDIGGSRF